MARISRAFSEKRLVTTLWLCLSSLANGLDQDAYGLRAFAANHKELLVASSFSKNFGLYNERVGAFTLVAENAEIASTA